MIAGLAEQAEQARKVTPEERAARFHQKTVTLWLRGANARELAYQVERKLFDLGHAAAVLDDDKEALHAGLIASSLNRAGLICLCPREMPPSMDAATHWSVDVAGLDADSLLEQLHKRGVL